MERLRRRADFELVFASGRSVPGSAIALRIVQRDDHGASRVGITAGKRLDRRAVVRNRIRRRLREALRPLDLTPGYDVVAIARPKSGSLPWGQLQAAIADTFRRADLLVPGDER